MEPTQALAGYVARLDYESIPEQVVHTARRAFVDTLGCAIAGTGEDAARLALAMGREDGGSPRATVLGAAACGSSLRLPPQNAAMINAIAGHALDYDDVNAMGHPSAPVCFTALAAAEDAGASGRELLTGYVAGIEVETKVNRAFGESHYLLGWHSTGTVGVWGAVAAAAKIYRLSEEQIAIAFGIAASQACGLRQNFGTMTKPYHPGHASWAGIVAARLARSGFTADRAILDSKFGYYPVYSAGPYDAAKTIGELGKWALMTPGLSVKKYPCCYCTHASIDAALALREQYKIDPAAVRAVTAELSPFYISPLIHHRPATGLEGKFSIEYTLAAALLDGRVALASFTDEMVRREQARALVEKTGARACKVEAEGVAATFARLHIELGDGGSLVKEVSEPRGAAGNPMSDGEIEAKFLDCWSFPSARHGNADAPRALDMLWHLDHQPGVAELAASLA
jgi:2-methylcitrate dehydratase PrpD